MHNLNYDDKIKSVIKSNLEKEVKDSVKVFYRNTFAQMGQFVNFKFFLDKVGIKSSNFSLFMKGAEYDGYISSEKLNELLLCINEYLEIKKFA